MNPLLILTLSFIIALICGMPVAISMGLAAMLAIAFTPEIPISHFVETMYGSSNSYALISLPMFLLAGYLMQHGGMAKRIVDFATAVVGRIAGGLSAACILAMAIFSAMSGSGPATTAAVGSIMIPAMDKQGYKNGYAEGVAACAGGLGIVIPPSIPLILIALQLQISIPKLFLAGIIPGIVIAIFLLVTNHYLAAKRGYRGAPLTDEQKEQGYTISVLDSAWNGKWALFAPVIILGSIYTGVVTITEASVIAVLYAFIIGVLVYRELNLKTFALALRTTIQVVGVIVVLLVTGTAFAQLVAWHNLPTLVLDWMTALDANLIVLTLIMVALLVFIGMWMETIAQIFIFAPVFFPIMTTAGMDPYTYAIVFIVGCEIGFDTPPLGANLFIVAELGNNRFEDIAAFAGRFAIAEIAAMIVIALVPWLTTWLPALSTGQ